MRQSSYLSLNERRLGLVFMRLYVLKLVCTNRLYLEMIIEYKDIHIVRKVFHLSKDVNVNSIDKSIDIFS